jgi:hypothetical protein
MASTLAADEDTGRAPKLAAFYYTYSREIAQIAYVALLCSVRLEQ